MIKLVCFASRRLISWLVFIGLIFGISAVVRAQQVGDFAPDDSMDELFIGLCITNSPNFFDLFAADPDRALALFTLCTVRFPGDFAGAATGSSASIPSNFALGSISQSGNKRVLSPRATMEKRIEERRQDEEGGGASADSYRVGDVGFFVTGQHGDTRRDSTVNELGYEDNSNAFMLGADVSIDAGIPILIGGALSRESNATRFVNSGGKIKTLGTGAMLFASASPFDGTTFNLYSGYVRHDNDSVRNISFANLSGPINSEFGSRRFSLGAGAAHDFFIGDLTLSFSANLDYSNTRVDGYDERGLTAAELNFESQRQRTLTASAGVQVSYTMYMDGVSITPNVAGRYAHEFENDAREIRATYQLVPDRQLVFSTDGPDRDVGYISGGLTVGIDPSVQLFANYEVLLGHSFMSNESIFGGIVARFE